MNKIIFILTFSICLSLSLKTSAQTIISSAITPTAPLTTDTIKISIISTFPQSSCQGTVSVISGSIVTSADGMHCMGSTVTLCTDTDYVVINPPHSAGTHSFYFSLNSGYWPGCSPGFVPYDYDTIVYNVGNIMSLNGLSNKIQHFNVFPNPASDKLNISFNSWSPDEFLVDVLDVTGRVVCHEKLISSPYTNKMIDLKQISNGTYFIRLTSAKGETLTQKFQILKN